VSVIGWEVIERDFWVTLHEHDRRQNDIYKIENNEHLREGVIV